MCNFSSGIFNQQLKAWKEEIATNASLVVIKLKVLHDL